VTLFASSSPGTSRHATPHTRKASADPPRRRRWARIGIIGVLTGALLGLGAGVASAHVTVNPSDAAAGSYAKLTFRVPTESDTASTVSVQVSLPTDHPFASVSLQPVPGWTATTKTTTFDPPLKTGKFNLTDAVSSITWTADDGVGVKPGQFQEFSISVGPVPDVTSLTFPATQTYSDGSVVNWDEVAKEGQDRHDLDHPAPVLTIAAAGAPEVASAGSAPTASDSAAQILAAVALVIAAVALVVAALGWRRRGPKAAQASTPRDAVTAASVAGPGPNDQELP